MEKELVFYHPEFEKIVRKKLTIEDRPIYLTDVLNIFELDLSGFCFDIRDCEALSQFKNLQCLDIDFGFEDISFIASLKNLTDLSFEYGYDFDFKYLSELENLKDLFVSGGVYSSMKLINLEMISEISSLESLCLHEFGYVDLHPLKKMRNLKRFLCGWADKVDNYDSIGELKNLEELILIDFQMDNIEFLKKLPVDMSLELCGIQFTKEIDISILERFEEKDISEITINNERVLFDGDYI